jgi:uncharacterized paraquat-inducible protein A
MATRPPTSSWLIRYCWSCAQIEGLDTVRCPRCLEPLSRGRLSVELPAEGVGEMGQGG